MPLSPYSGRGCVKSLLHGVVPPDLHSQGDLGEWIVLSAGTTCVANARDVRSSGVLSLMHLLQIVGSDGLSGTAVWEEVVKGLKGQLVRIPPRRLREGVMKSCLGGECLGPARYEMRRCLEGALAFAPSLV